MSEQERAQTQKGMIEGYMTWAKAAEILQDFLNTADTSIDCDLGNALKLAIAALQRCDKSTKPQTEYSRP